MYYVYPEDVAAYEYPNQYLLGGRILVSPLSVPGGIKTTDIPADQCISLFDGLQYEGPQEITDCYTIDEFPIFVKAGNENKEYTHSEM